MKKISSFVLCALLVSCSFSKNEKSDVSEVSAKEESSVTRQETGFNTELTYPAWNPRVKIDHIFARPMKGWKVVKTQTVQSLLSDHLPIITDLEYIK